MSAQPSSPTLATYLKTNANRDERMQKKLPFWAKEMYNIAR
jgi:hypothetical protein